MKFKFKIYLKNIIFIAVFATALGALFNYSHIDDFTGSWYKWTSAGITAGLLLSLFGSFLDTFVLKKRKLMLTSPYFQSVKQYFSLTSYGHLLAGRYQNYPFSIGWNTLPIKKIPRPGIFIFLVFQPVRSEQLFEIKKRLRKTDRLMVESFYIYQFIQVDDLGSFPVKKIETLLQDNIRAIQANAGPPAAQKCINCQREISEGSFKIINDIPAPLCDSCAIKAG